MSEPAPFVKNLMKSFRVESPSLAIFLLVLICLACVFIVGLLVVLVWCYVREVLHRKRLQKTNLKRVPSFSMGGYYQNEADSKEYGQLFFSLHYDYSYQTLTVTAIRAEHLKPALEDVGMDTYVLIRLASDKKGKFEQIASSPKSELERRSRSPAWNFSYQFNMKHEDWLYMILLFDVFQIDASQQERNVGRLMVHLNKIDPTTHIENTVEHVDWLRVGESPYHGLGEVSIGLGYQHVLERLECQIFEARNLMIKREETYGPEQKVSVQVELCCEGRSLGAFETSEKSDLVNPYFNKKVVYHLKRTKLEFVRLICRLQTRSKRGRKQTVGSFVIGHNIETFSGAKQWDSMIQQSPGCVVSWHTVTPNTF